MIPNPLHPAVVHFPIVFSVLLPFVALGALWVIRRGAAPQRAWALPLTLAAALTVSAFVALRTGQAQEEKVESVVGEAAFGTHEEAAEFFLVLSGVLLLVAGAGLAPGVVGRAARIVATLGALGLLGSGWRTGHSGGQLVYVHNAASVYTTASSAAAAEADGSGTGDKENEEHERE